MKHVGVLRALHGHPQHLPVIVAGTSAGSIVAALGDTINALIGYRSFDDLDIDLAVVASDIEHQRRVLFTSRRVARRVDHDELHRFLPPPLEGKPGCETRVLGGFPDIGLALATLLKTAQA